MVRALPPLNWVRTFEAAARHESFLRAAQELGVSAGAVSQQVKSLEKRLGTTLFERQTSGVRLSKAGLRYCNALTPALDAIDQASRLVGEGVGPAHLRLAALPAIAERWLTPRLAGFHAAAPEIAVQLSTAETVALAARKGFDVAIHYETEATGGWHVVPLFQDRALPVCSPSLRQQLELRVPADAARCRLLYDTQWMRDWPLWWRAAGLPARDLDREFGFSLYSMAVEAAVAGQGLLMGHRSLVDTELKSGRLVAPFTIDIPVPHRYVALCAEGDAERPPIAAFLRWLRAEATENKMTTPRTQANNRGR